MAPCGRRHNASAAIAPTTPAREPSPPRASTPAGRGLHPCMHPGDRFLSACPHPPDESQSHLPSGGRALAPCSGRQLVVLIRPPSPSGEGITSGGICMRAQSPHARARYCVHRVGDWRPQPGKVPAMHGL
ncbi:hypothetical protein C8Q80DRAFT_42248 [Daedaleopsis nitida]|nr:hypothetical protein C8Q80DRAFT_42248 [Daedaleopsis nitida]